MSGSPSGPHRHNLSASDHEQEGSPPCTSSQLNHKRVVLQWYPSRQGMHKLRYKNNSDTVNKFLQRCFTLRDCVQTYDFSDYFLVFSPILARLFQLQSQFTFSCNNDFYGNEWNIICYRYRTNTGY